MVSLMQSVGFSPVVALRLNCPAAHESVLQSEIKPASPCIGRLILNHWTSREVPQSKPYSLCFICDAYFTDGDTGTAEVVACLSDRAKAAEDISEVCPHHSLFLAQLSHLPLHFLLGVPPSFPTSPLALSCLRQLNCSLLLPPWPCWPCSSPSTYSLAG